MPNWGWRGEGVGLEKNVLGGKKSKNSLAGTSIRQEYVPNFVLSKSFEFLETKKKGISKLKKWKSPSNSAYSN